MIYVSSAAVRAESIADAVRQLAEAGYRAIELTGGTRWYAGFTDDLLELRAHYDLNFLCHNYFPPPSEPFVLNLASLDEDVSGRSLTHARDAMRLSRELGAPRYGVHAGFLIDISVSEVGRPIERRALADRSAALQRFVDNYERLSAEDPSPVLYLENNVIAGFNFERYHGVNPFLLTDSDGVRELETLIDFRLLLDVAHLKVSAHTLGLDFARELSSLAATTDYLHVSDNDALRDSNQGLSRDSALYAQLRELDLRGKTLTLEIYSGLDELHRSYELVAPLVG